MRNKFITIVSYLLIFFNSNLFSNENNNALKIGLLAPLSGEYKELGNSLLSVSYTHLRAHETPEHLGWRGRR